MSVYLERLDGLSRLREQEVLKDLEPVIVAAMGELGDLIAALPEDELKRELALQELVAEGGPAEKGLAKVNDRLRAELSHALANATPLFRQLAAGQIPGSRTDFPQLDAQSLLRSVEVDGQSLEKLFRRASPSPWMKQLLSRVESATRAGWARDRRGRDLAVGAVEAIGTNVRNAAQVVTDSAFWRHVQTQQWLVWDTAPAAVQPRAWRWDTPMAERVCPICRPLDGLTASSREDFPEIPAHPCCRCGLNFVR